MWLYVDFNPIIVLFLTLEFGAISVYLCIFQSYYSLIFNSIHVVINDDDDINFNPIIVLFLTAGLK